VYFGGEGNVANSSPVWRFTSKDALRSPSVPAADEFKQAITEAEKQQTAKP
jgi:hypothetical protein